MPARIVIIEDDDAFYEVLVMILERTSFAGVPVQHAGTLEEAKAIIADRPEGSGTSVVLCDQALPDSQAGRTLERVLQLVDDRDVVLAMTSLDDAELAEAVSRLGAQDYIVKDETRVRYLDRRIRAAIERKELINEVARVNAELDAFTKVVSHDLKSPLAVMMVSLNALQRAAGREEDVYAIVGSLREECKTMAEIIDSLLEYARGSSSDEHAEPILPEDVIADAVRQLKPTIAERKANVRVQALPAVHGVRRPLIQVFQNLIANAIRHNANSTPTVTISGVRHEKVIRISVADNGVGIAPEEVERVFGLGAQGGATRGGTGLGLAIARRYVDRQGGRLYVLRSGSTGTEFIVELPAGSMPDLEEA